MRIIRFQNLLQTSYNGTVMSNAKRVLVVMPSFPIPETGAEQMDRAEGMRQMVRLGYEVVVITKLKETVAPEEVAQLGKQIGVRVVGVPYRFSNCALSLREKILKHLGKFKHPLFLDGAAYEYSEPGIQEALRRELQEFRPDVVWFEYTYLWPLYGLVRKAGIPIVTRSINFEPEHFLEEDGRTFINYIKYVPKWFGERRTARMSDVVLAITPKEQQVYERMGAKDVKTLPLRSLPRFTTLPRPLVRNESPLHVFFMGSSYNVAHNRAALSAILKDIAPQVERKAPGRFVFHVLGTKVPKELEMLFDGVHTVYEGPKYKQELDAFIAGMDIALVPSFMGAGQQQKVFEPIIRGIPTVTSPRAIADYPLRAGTDYMNAHVPVEFVARLIEMQDLETRNHLSKQASDTTARLFAPRLIDEVVLQALRVA